MQEEKKKKKGEGRKGKKRSTGTTRRTSACLHPRVTHTHCYSTPTALLSQKAKEKSFPHISLTPHQPAEGLISTEVNCSGDCPTRDFVLMLTLRLFPLSFCSLLFISNIHPFFLCLLLPPVLLCPPLLQNTHCTTLLCPCPSTQS